MEPVAEITSVARVIQTAIAPVFLLTGIGAILGVMANRLSRIVDRFRALENMESRERSAHNDEMMTLARRARWIHAAVTLGTCAALFICVVIAVLFISAQIGADPARVVALLFIMAMLALISGLLCF
ncbi:MAG TPA: DUF2721 domain-containing protein, partial [Rhodocyclaceae bacterium]|nr:DUF2721 domain-containing protein [Rhodocyclaceae bacterium]